MAFLWLLAPAVVAAGGEAVRLKTEEGLTARGLYAPGEPDRPAVLLLHGFLQTHDFPTVRRLADALNEDEGYPVLTPTLTLGIDDRSSSLACEAVQKHDMEQAVKEISAWVAWLIRRGHERMVLVGHSTGSVMITAYLERASPEVKQAILVSLTHFGPRQAVFKKEAGEALSLARSRMDDAKTQEGLADFSIAYCRRYVTTPARILSYYAWNARKVLEALASSPVPVTVILGTKDKRMDGDWVASLEPLPRVRLKFVEGADHFFDAEHEFSLLEAVLETLEELEAQ